MIFEAIAAIKIANEAIGAIKEFAGHVESVGAMGKDLTKLADAKDELQKSAADGDMEAFWALEGSSRTARQCVRTNANVQKLKEWLEKKPSRMHWCMVLLALVSSVLWAGPWPYYCILLALEVGKNGYQIPW